MMGNAIDRLRHDDCTLVVENGTTRTFTERGIATLYRLLGEEPEFLKGASVADKVVGKGAAALMMAGSIGALYAEVISEPALALLATASDAIYVKYGTIVPQIENRSRTGMCPVEQICLHAHTAEECLPLIKSFMNRTK